MREQVRDWLETPRVRAAIQYVIVFNALILGLETSGRIYAAMGGLLETLDRICLAIFVVEIGLKIYANGSRFFRNGWDLFDFIIVGVSVIPGGGGNLSVLRTLRILRLMRVISIAPQLRVVVEGLVRALPGLGSVFLLLGIVFYVGSVIATQLFGGAYPELFGTLGESAFSLFTVMTLEGWPDIARKVMETFPNAWIFFVLFIMGTAFCALNLLVGLIVNSMEDAHSEARQEKQEEYQDEALTALRDIQLRLERMEQAAGESRVR
jgi:voltage-gated sodium channel